LFVSLLCFDITQPVELFAAATSQTAGLGSRAQRAGLDSPSNTHAVAGSDSRIDVDWQDNSITETGFEVHRAADGSNGVFTLVATTAAGVTARADPGLNPSTQYCYKVRAFKTADGRTRYSDFSNTACATTKAPPPQSGSIQVTTATTGFDVDVDGYFVRVDGGPDQPIGTNATITMTDVAADNHTVWLGQVAPNCSVDGANPRTVSVAGGATAEVSIAVTCGSGPSIQVTTVTTGVNLDADGYGVMLWLRSQDGSSRISVASASVAATGTVRFFGLTTGQYEVEFNGLAANCMPTSPNPLPVDLSYEGAVAVEFDVTCGPGGSSCEVQECMSEICPQGYICGYDGCCVPHCFDGQQNGDEGDVDCGGSCAAQCTAGQHCFGFWDCASGVCVNGACQP
jgi:hypothetical protein